MQIDFKSIDTILPELGVGVVSGSGVFATGNILVANGHAGKGQVEGGVVLQRKLIAYTLVVSVGLAQLATMVNPAGAAQTSAAMPVSVTVIANAKMQTHYQATQLKISKEDVARGYVKVSAASRFEVSTNSRSGYLMEFYPIGNLFESVQIEGLGNTVQLGADGGTIVQRGLRPQNLTQELSFRFTLSADTLPGRYPWPLLLSVRPL